MNFVLVLFDLSSCAEFWQARGVRSRQAIFSVNGEEVERRHNSWCPEERGVRLRP
jgi:hypothetical protein